MKKIKVLLVSIACIVTMGVLVGCTSNSDISDYLQALLDTSYKNEVSKFVDIKLGTEDDASKLYSQGINEGVATLCESLSVPAGYDEEFKDLYSKMLKLVKYDVGSAVKQSDGSYTVTVTYETMNIFEPAVEIYEKKMTQIVEGWATSDEDISDEEKQQQAIQEFKNAMEEAFDDVTYDEPKETTVRIELVDNQYTPNMTDVQELEKNLLDWE